MWVFPGVLGTWRYSTLPTSPLLPSSPLSFPITCSAFLLSPFPKIFHFHWKPPAVWPWGSNFCPLGISHWLKWEDQRWLLRDLTSVTVIQLIWGSHLIHGSVFSRLPIPSLQPRNPIAFQCNLHNRCSVLDTPSVLIRLQLRNRLIEFAESYLWGSVSPLVS